MIGVDFDNTLICHDAVFLRLARAEGLVPPGAVLRQKAIREAARASAEGDLAWQRLQGLAYGPRLREAEAFPGALGFLRRCREEGLAVRVISHKTRLAGFDPTGTDLHQAALAWLRDNGFFGPETGLGPADVRFAASRAEKVALIAELGCSHFIDDLEETFREPGFPDGVRRILFAPGQEGPGPAGLFLVRSFAEVGEAVFGPDLDRVARLAGSPPVSLALLGGGRNSRVHRVDCADGSRYALKSYFRHPFDPRDRLAGEFGSLRFLWGQGLRCLPRPLAADPEAGLGLYECIDGVPVLDPGTADLDQVLAFAGELRRLAALPEAAALAPASEACFSVRALADSIDSRLARLRALADAGPLGGFLEGELLPAWQRLLAQARDGCARAGIPYEEELPAAATTLSPSDFGFHNALRRGDELVFLDLEYFGRDDPAKLVADFLLHPGMELAPDLRRRFLDGALRLFPGLAGRVRLLLPLFGIKWCLILLNEFLPDSLERRRFADPAGGSAEQRQAGQLAKARVKLHQLLDDHGDSLFPHP